MPKQMTLRTRLLASILSITFLTFTLAVGIVSYKARNLALKNAEKIAEEMGGHYGYQIAEPLDLALKTARNLAVTMEGLHETGRSDRESVNLILRKTVEENPVFLGTWTCWEPDAFDGNDSDWKSTPGHDSTGRFIPYWYRSGGSVESVPLEGYDQNGIGDYYLLPFKAGHEILMDPFPYEVKGKEILMTTVAVPVKSGGKVLGVVGIDLSLEDISKFVETIRPFRTGYTTLLSNNGTFVGDGWIDGDGKKLERLGQKLSEYCPEDEVRVVREGKHLKKTDFSQYINGNFFRIYSPITVGKTGTPWSLNLNIPEKTIQAEARTIMLSGIAVGLVSLLLMSLVVLWIATGIARPIGLAVDKMKKVAQGDLTEEIDKSFKIHEITELKEAINTMIGEVSSTVKSILTTSNEVNTRAEDMSAASEEATASIEEVIALTGKTAANTQETASSVEETNAGAEEVAAGAQAGARAAGEAGENAALISTAADEGGKAVEVMVRLIGDVAESSGNVGTAVNDLAQSVSGISDFVETITRIADQTNLLALNAAIEAARAGDAGRGFAVVADEVRKLAEESNSAATKVSKIIGDISEKTENALRDHNGANKHVEGLVKKAEQTRHVIQDVVEKVAMITESIQTIAAAMEEQSASTEEMTAGMDNISRATQEVALDVENINASMEEQGKVAETIASSAEDLVQLSRTMEKAVARFRVNTKG